MKLLIKGVMDLDKLQRGRRKSVVKLLTQTVEEEPSDSTGTYSGGQRKDSETG